MPAVSDWMAWLTDECEEDLSMNTYLIVLQPLEPKEIPYDLTPVLRNLGRECHVMSHAWALQTPRSAGDVLKELQGSGMVDPRDPVIIAPLAAPDWIGQECRKPTECFG
jgi:hypothetical protein